MKKLLLGITVAAGTVLSLFTGGPAPAQAVLSCSTTDTVTSGTSVLGSFLTTPGNCVEAGDKLFGNFVVGGAITSAGSASFSFLSPNGNVTVGVSGTLAPRSIGSLSYEVGIIPALANGFLINALTKDLTFNPNTELLPARATLAAATIPVTSPVVNITCTRLFLPAIGSTSTCPITASFAPIDDITLNEVFVTSTNAVVTGFTDTISQVFAPPPPPVPEPASLMLLGTALLGLGAIGRRRR